MKNLIVFSLVAVCAVLVSSEKASAAIGGGGGKTASKARVIMKNVDARIGVAVWIRPVGTALPKTLGAFRKKLIYLGPNETRRTSKLKNGAYTMSIVDAANTAGPSNMPINPNNLPPILGNQNFNINGKDRTANVHGGGIGFTN